MVLMEVVVAVKDESRPKREPQLLNALLQSVVNGQQGGLPGYSKLCWNFTDL
jgi:hypothetical protein